MGDTIPPEDYITNENMEIFLLSCWENGEKPNVQQGKKWLNHILTATGQPTLNDHHRQAYASVLDLLHGLRKEPRWRGYATEGAEPMTPGMMKQILTATVFDVPNKVNAVKLRNKGIAGCLLTLGLHPEDIHNITDEHVIDLPDHVDRDGKRRPKFMFNGFPKTKQHWKFIRNTVGCGCPGHHDPRDERCLYNVLKWYSTVKDAYDDQVQSRPNKFKKANRATHFDEKGHLVNKTFFRAMNHARNGCSPQKAAQPPQHRQARDPRNLRVLEPGAGPHPRDEVRGHETDYRPGPEDLLHAGRAVHRRSLLVRGAHSRHGPHDLLHVRGPIHWRSFLTPKQAHSFVFASRRCFLGSSPTRSWR